MCPSEPHRSTDLATAGLAAPARDRRPLVMVIEDDADIRSAIEELLDGEGFATIGAADGQAALNLLADLRDRPALILLDLMMPILDGWTFCKIRQGIAALMEIPVVVISAASMTATQEPLQVDGRIQKPFEADALVRLVTLMVERTSVHERLPGEEGGGGCRLTAASSRRRLKSSL